MNNWQKENENKIKTLEADVLSAVTNYSDNAQDILELLNFCNKFSKLFFCKFYAYFYAKKRRTSSCFFYNF